MSFPDWSPAFQAALERLTLSAQRPARASMPGARRSRFRGRALEFADYRPYTPGDDPKLIDWRVYSRTDRLYLKQFDEERARTVTLLIDTSASLDFGDGSSHKGEFARRLAAALAWVALNRQEPVRVWLLQGDAAIPAPATSTRAGALKLFQALATTLEHGQANLANAVESALRGHRAGPVILISDLFDPNWAAAITRLGQSGEGCLIQTLSPDEWRPPLGDEVELLDAETAEIRATTLNPKELAAYHTRLAAFLGDIKQHCARHNIAYAALDTGEPFADVVLKQLTAAGILR